MNKAADEVSLEHKEDLAEEPGPESLHAVRQKKLQRHHISLGSLYIEMEPTCVECLQCLYSAFEEVCQASGMLSKPTSIGKPGPEHCSI